MSPQLTAPRKTNTIAMEIARQWNSPENDGFCSRYTRRGGGVVRSASSPAAIQLFDCRDAYVGTLEEMAAADGRVCAVANDSLSSAKLKNFEARFPDRFVNVGIAEQNMVGVASGLANGGMIPYVCSASCFLTARAMEQVKVDLAYSKANVKLCAMSPGMAYGQLGPTHHSIEDVAWMRVLPNMTVIVPADPVETAAAMRYSLVHAGPMFLRIARVPVPPVHGGGYEFKLGKAVRLRDGGDVTLIANGLMVSRALDAARALEKCGVSARVLNMSTVKPLDREAILDAARTTKGIVTTEEALAAGGLGGAVAEVLAVEHPAPMRMLGVPDTFAPTGKAEFLLEHFGLTATGIERAAMELMRREG
jgi:transketolase